MTADELILDVDQMDCRHGRFMFPKLDIYIGESLRRYGEWCEPELDILLKLLQPGNCVIEAGANIGADTVPMAKRVGDTGHVFAFEPQRVMFSLLARNLQDNHCRNVNIYQAATNMKDGELSIPKVDYGKMDNYGGVSMLKAGLGDPVPGVALDEFLDPTVKVHLIKADVEGMELPTLIGASKIIGNSRPILFVENNCGPHSGELIRFLQQIDYQCWWLMVDLFQPTNFRGSTEDVFPNTVCQNMVCLPSGSPLVELLPELPPVLSPRDLGPTRPKVVRP